MSTSSPPVSASSVSKLATILRISLACFVRPCFISLLARVRLWAAFLGGGPLSAAAFEDSGFLSRLSADSVGAPHMALSDRKTVPPLARQLDADAHSTAATAAHP